MRRPPDCGHCKVSSPAPFLRGSRILVRERGEDGLPLATVTRLLLRNALYSQFAVHRNQGPIGP